MCNFFYNNNRFQVKATTKTRQREIKQKTDFDNLQKFVLSVNELFLIEKFIFIGIIVLCDNDIIYFSTRRTKFLCENRVEILS